MEAKRPLLCRRGWRLTSRTELCENRDVYSPQNRPYCVLGLGLIGGSLLRDLAHRKCEVFGWDRSPKTVSAAQDEGFDVSSDVTALLERAEAADALIIIATPMPAVGRVLDMIQQSAPSCGITDVVSVKQAVLQEIRSRDMEVRYVGGHPMSGTANSGWEASQQGLFRDAPWVVTFDRDDVANDNSWANDVADPSHQRWLDVWVRVVQMAVKVGAEVIPARAHTHDAAVARISHLPHMLSESLAIVGDNGGALALSLAAGSFRDGTRVASTRPPLVQAMCENNADALVGALDEAITILRDAREQLAGPEQTVEELTSNGYRSRVRYEARTGKRPVIRLRPGTPGWVAQLAHAENLGARIEIF